MILGSFTHAGASYAATLGSTWTSNPSNTLWHLMLPVLSKLKGAATGAGKAALGRGHGGTHHFEVFRGALLPTEEAGQQHLANVVTSPVIKLQHVERFGLEVPEVCLVLQDFQLLLVGALGVWDLVSWGKEQAEAQA